MFDRPKPKRYRDVDGMGVERRTCVDCTRDFRIHHQITQVRCERCRDKHAQALLRGKW